MSIYADGLGDGIDDEIMQYLEVDEMSYKNESEDPAGEGGISSDATTGYASDGSAKSQLNPAPFPVGVPGTTGSSSQFGSTASRMFSPSQQPFMSDRSQTPQISLPLNDQSLFANASTYSASTNMPSSEDMAQVFLGELVFGTESFLEPRKADALPDHKEYTQVLRDASMKNNLKYQVRLNKFPPRSRVETQIKCRLSIWPPPRETLLHLPSDTMARPRFQLRDLDQIKGRPDVLWLEVDAVVPEDTENRVFMCGKCLARERKRAFRKKTLDPHEESHWHESQLRRVIIFNCREVVSLPPPLKTRLSSGELVDAREIEFPLRLACYCRHHSAKNGYVLVFSLRDHEGTLVGRAVSTPVFITDNHKEPRAGAGSAVDDRPATGYHPYAHSRSNSSDWSSSTHSSTGPSPSASGPGTGLMAPSPMSSSMSSAPSPAASVSSLTAPAGGTDAEPIVQRVIPAQGSIRGGIEITLLGQNFRPGLVALFGGTPAINTQCWSETTMIAHLPPTHQAGIVPVTFEKFTPRDSAIFTYINDAESKLKELALQVVGFKLSGRVEDAGEIAQRILREGREENPEIGGGFGGAIGPSDLASSGDSISSEVLTLRILKVVRELGRIPQLNLRNSEGQTMMHLAAILGYAPVVTALIAQGATVALQDVSGYTPLHFSAMYGQRHITRLLLDTGDVDPFHRTLSGDTVADVSDPTVADLLPRDQRSYYQDLNSRSSSSLLEMLKPSTKDDALLAPLTPPTESKPPAYHHIYPSHSVIMLDVSESDDDADAEQSSASEFQVPSAAASEVDLSDTDHEQEGDEDDEDDEIDEDDKVHESQILSMWVANPLKDFRNDLMLFAFWIPVFFIALAALMTLYLSQPEAGPWRECIALKAAGWIERGQTFGANIRAKLMPMPPVERSILGRFQ